MKRTLFVLISVVLSSCLLAAKCKKDKVEPPDNPYGLPNATQTGVGMFAFREDNTNMVYKYIPGYGGGYHSLLSGLYKNDTLIVVAARPSDLPPPLGWEFIFKLYGNIVTGKVYNLADTTQIFCQYEVGGLPECIQRHNAQPFYPTTGTFTLTKLDVVKRIMSGRFDNIKIPVNNCTATDTLNITNGRFDFSYFNDLSEE